MCTLSVRPGKDQEEDSGDCVHIEKAYMGSYLQRGFSGLVDLEYDQKLNFVQITIPH